MPVVSANLTVSVASTNTTVYTAATDVIVNIYVLNPTSNIGNIRLAVSSAVTPATNDYIFYDFPISANGTLIVDDVHISSGHKVWIYSPTGFVVRVSGATEPSITTSSAPTIASATTIAPSARITFVSGTTAVATITPPAALGAFNNQIVLIPTGAWTTTTAGNIALASTAVANRALTMTYDATTTKWYPSY